MVHRSRETRRNTGRRTVPHDHVGLSKIKAIAARGI